MKSGDFKHSTQFTNMFTMMDFCYKRGLTNNNSILEQKGDEDIYILYYN